MPSSATYCVDASVVIRSFQPHHPEIHRLWDEFRRSGASLVAPHLLWYEVTNALHRLRRVGDLDQAAMEHLMSLALALPIDLHGDSDLYLEALGIAGRFDLPAAYDAHYLALAQRLGVDFWTTDAGLVKAVGDALPWVRLVG